MRHSAFAALASGLFLLAAGGHASAQPQEWTLAQCVDHAVANSNTIRQRQIAVEMRENDLSTSRGSHLPSVSAYAGQSFDFGRGLTVDNTYANRNTRNTSMGIQASVPLFEGFRTVNGVKVARLNLAAATEDLAAAKEDLGISVAQAFLRVLSTKEIALRTVEQMRLSQAQLERREALYANGKTSESEVFAARSLVAQDEMTAVGAANDYHLALLDLSQLLELPSPDSIAVVSPDTAALTPGEFPTPEEIYREALASKPDIRAAQARAESAERQIAVARGAYSPSLTLSGGVSTGYYAMSGQDNEKLGKQLDNNLNKSISLSLSVPIFNRFASRNGVRQAQMTHTSSLVDLEEARKTLYKEIQQAYYNAVASRATFESSRAAAESAEAAFRLAEARYAEGLSSSTDYAEARTNRIVALANMIQYKYDMLFRGKILDFYRGVEIH